MKLLTQLAIIFAVCLAGDAISALLPIPVPGSVLAMVLLLLLLLCKAVKPAQIGDLSDWLLKNMAFLFVPSGVGILKSVADVQGNIIKLLLVCLITMVLTFGVTALTVGAVIRLQQRLKGERRNA